MVALVTLALSTGCAAVQAGKVAAVGKAAEIVQDGLTDAEWFVCTAAPVGSVMDRYGKTAAYINHALVFLTPCDNIE